MVMFLALSMIVQNFITAKKKRMILPLLREESSGPFSSTRISSGGAIVPTVVYLEERPLRKHGNGGVEYTRPQEILKVMDLLEDGTGGDRKIISEEMISVATTTSEHPPTDIAMRSLTPESLTAIISIPLSPAYHATRQVPRVWSQGHRVEQLYRYSHFDRMVYPPGYVVESFE